MNHLDEAFSALRRAVRLGYDDARWLNKDPDLENLRRDSRFDRIRDNISKKRQEP